MHFRDVEISGNPSYHSENKFLEYDTKVQGSKSGLGIVELRGSRLTSPPKSLARSISYIHHTSEYQQYCYVENTAQQCRLGLFQDSDFAGDFEDSKSTSGGFLCIFGSHTFLPLSWMCKKKTSVSHSSTEADIISPHAGLRTDGIPAHTLWDLVIEVFHSVPNRTNEPQERAMGKAVSRCVVG